MHSQGTWLMHIYSLFYCLAATVVDVPWIVGFIFAFSCFCLFVSFSFLPSPPPPPPPPTTTTTEISSNNNNKINEVQRRNTVFVQISDRTIAWHKRGQRWWMGKELPPYGIGWNKLTALVTDTKTPAHLSPLFIRACVHAFLSTGRGKNGKL